MKAMRELLDWCAHSLPRLRRECRVAMGVVGLC